MFPLLTEFVASTFPRGRIIRKFGAEASKKLPIFWWHELF